MGAGKTIFDGLASFGRFESIMALVFAVPIGLLFIVIGLAVKFDTPANDPSHPNQISGNAARIGFVAVGSLVIVGAAAQYWFAKKSPVYAAVEGGSDLARMVGKAVKNLF